MIPAYDNHLHLRPEGMCIEAVKIFRKYGGTHFNLVVSPLNIKYDEKYYQKIYDVTVKIADKIRSELGIFVLVTLGPHPADISVWLKNGDLDYAKEMMLRGIDLAARYVEEGKANAIGEVGRPHYPVSQELWDASNQILLYAMEKAKEVGCPVVLHTESPTTETFRELAQMADKVGLRREKVIKHYSPPFIRDEENHGIFPSLIASRKNVIEAIKKGKRFFMETDYIDDPKRPNAVLPVYSVPKRNRMLLEMGLATEEDLHVVHVENVEKIYGVEVKI